MPRPKKLSIKRGDLCSELLYTDIYVWVDEVTRERITYYFLGMDDTMSNSNFRKVSKFYTDIFREPAPKKHKEMNKRKPIKN